ncbi:MAG TPA: 2Fe-2S iron-sulfur cluster-binding protein [Dyella sp.]|uniref:(2Fe-2S)-binding protein n=1 Tax=Dyella sp. TaxID=1869338 RepID=UPI002F938BF1
MAAPLQAQSAPAPSGGTGIIAPEKAREGIDLEVNGERFRHTGDPKMPLLWYLRDVLRLTGTKYAGERGSGSGADLVIVNGKLVSAVAVTIEELHIGKSGSERPGNVLTVEGLAGGDGKLHPLQQAFVDEDAIGCGYCTPGWLMAAKELLDRKRNPSDDDIDQLPNLCRCGCQTRVRRAIKRVAAATSGNNKP